MLEHRGWEMPPLPAASLDVHCIPLLPVAVPPGGTEGCASMGDPSRSRIQAEDGVSRG